MYPYQRIYYWKKKFEAEAQGIPFHEGSWGGRRFGLSPSEMTKVLLSVGALLYRNPTLSLKTLAYLVELSTNIKRSSMWFSRLLKNLGYSYKQPDFKALRKFSISNLQQ